MTQRYNKWNEYDQILEKLVQMHGSKNWTVIAKIMKKEYEIVKRNGKQCRERWINHLDKANQASTWLLQQDLQLIQFLRKYGTRWSDIARNFPKRSDNNVKNRFYSQVKKSVRKMCRYSGIKTTSLNVYNVLSNTYSHIFICGSFGQMEAGVSGNLKEYPIHPDVCQEVRNVIIQFITAEGERKVELPNVETVTQVLHKLMNIDLLVRKRKPETEQFDGEEEEIEQSQRSSQSGSKYSSSTPPNQPEVGEHRIKKQGSFQSDQMQEELDEAHKDVSIVSTISNTQNMQKQRQPPKSYCASLPNISLYQKEFQYLTQKMNSLALIRNQSQKSISDFHIQLSPENILPRAGDQKQSQMREINTPKSEYSMDLFERILQ